jgi:mannobiose 2-epimerase
MRPPPHTFRRLKSSYQKLADETEAMLRRDVLDVWFPRSVDNVHGGFNAGFNRQWQPTASEGKFSVFQGRMTWITSQIVLKRPEMKEQFLPLSQHGLAFLNDTLWDKQYGGFSGE